MRFARTLAASVRTNVMSALLGRCEFSEVVAFVKEQTARLSAHVADALAQSMEVLAARRGFRGVKKTVAW